MELLLVFLVQPVESCRSKASKVGSVLLRIVSRRAPAARVKSALT